MPEAVPLTSALGVDKHFIIEPLETEFGQIDDIMGELLATKAWELNIV